MSVLGWPKLALCYSMWALCWPQLPLSSPYFKPMFTYVGLSSLYLAPMLTLCSPMLALEMLSPIAVTETAEVTTGWERGRDGVTTGGSAVGGARLYNLRLPPKASGKDTGEWPSPGLKGYRPCRRPLSWRVGVLACPQNIPEAGSIERRLKITVGL